VFKGAIFLRGEEGIINKRIMDEKRKGGKERGKAKGSKVSPL